jgi:hypothetical protein
MKRKAFPPPHLWLLHKETKNRIDSQNSDFVAACVRDAGVVERGSWKNVRSIQ